MIECSYTTSSANESKKKKKFGMGSSDEMCIDFLVHYPLQKAPICQFSTGGKGRENPKALPYGGINRVFGYVFTESNLVDCSAAAPSKAR